MSPSSGPAHVSTRLAIGLLTHGSILICSPKNSSRLVDTFFRNPCILVPDTETQSSVNGVARGYIRARERGSEHSSPPWFSLASTQLKGESEVSPAMAALLWGDARGLYTIGRNGWPRISLEQRTIDSGHKMEAKYCRTVSKDRRLWMIN